MYDRMYTDTNGKHVEFHVFDLSGSVGADDMIVDPTAPSYSGLDEAQLNRKCEREKHGATRMPLVMTGFDTLGFLLRTTCRVRVPLPALQELLTAACCFVLLDSA
jgi:hypothetical protein